MADDPSQLSDFSDRYEDPAEDLLFSIDGDDPGRIDILIRKGSLKVGHIPESVRIVGRDEEIKDTATELRPIIQNDSPNSVMIYGKTGTGELLVARHVTGCACRTAESSGVSVETIYVDCA